MKKTVLFNKETNIITGFAEAQIDPVATGKKVKTALAKSVESKNFIKKKSTYASLKLAFDQAYFDGESVFYSCAKRLDMTEREMKFLMATNKKEAMGKLNAAETNLYDGFVVKRKTKQEDINQFIKDLRPEIEKMEKKQKELILSEAIYFGTRLGEDIIEDAELTTLVDKMKAKKSGELLKRDGTIIEKPKEVKEPS